GVQTCALPILSLAVRWMWFRRAQGHVCGCVDAQMQADSDIVGGSVAQQLSSLHGLLDLVLSHDGVYQGNAVGAAAQSDPGVAQPEHDQSRPLDASGGSAGCARQMQIDGPLAWPAGK